MSIPPATSRATTSFAATAVKRPKRKSRKSKNKGGAYRGVPYLYDKNGKLIAV